MEREWREHCELRKASGENIHGQSCAMRPLPCNELMPGATHDTECVRCWLSAFLIWIFFSLALTETRLTSFFFERCSSTINCHVVAFVLTLTLNSVKHMLFVIIF